jgi:hypothetical protein
MKKYPFMKYSNGAEIVRPDHWTDVVETSITLLQRVGYTEDASVSIEGIGLLTHMWSDVFESISKPETKPSIIPLILSFLTPYAKATRQNEVKEKANQRMVKAGLDNLFDVFPFPTIFKTGKTVVWNTLGSTYGLTLEWGKERKALRKVIQEKAGVTFTFDSGLVASTARAFVSTRRSGHLTSVQLGEPFNVSATVSASDIDGVKRVMTLYSTASYKLSKGQIVKTLYCPSFWVVASPFPSGLGECEKTVTRVLLDISKCASKEGFKMYKCLISECKRLSVETDVSSFLTMYAKAMYRHKREDILGLGKCPSSGSADGQKKYVSSMLPFYSKETEVQDDIVEDDLVEKRKKNRAEINGNKDGRRHSEGDEGVEGGQGDDYEDYSDEETSKSTKDGKQNKVKGKGKKKEARPKKKTEDGTTKDKAYKSNTGGHGWDD